jgi:hypothetical protein
MIFRWIPYKKEDISSFASPQQIQRFFNFNKLVFESKNMKKLFLDRIIQLNKIDCLIN